MLAAALLALLWGGAAPAWAHSSLISSSPAADSVLAQAPDRVELVFNEEIRDFQPKLAITVGAADPVEVTPTVDGATVRADLTGLGLAAVVDLRRGRAGAQPGGVGAGREYSSRQ